LDDPSLCFDFGRGEERDLQEMSWELAKRVMEGRGMPWKEAEEGKMLIATPLRHVSHQTKALQKPSTGDYDFLYRTGLEMGAGTESEAI
jgi:hypothetical protein